MLVGEGVEEGPLKQSSIDIQDRSRHSTNAFLADIKQAKGWKIPLRMTTLFLLFQILQSIMISLCLRD